MYMYIKRMCSLLISMTDKNNETYLKWTEEHSNAEADEKEYVHSKQLIKPAKDRDTVHINIQLWHIDNQLVR